MWQPSYLCLSNARIIGFAKSQKYLESDCHISRVPDQVRTFQLSWEVWLRPFVRPIGSLVPGKLLMRARVTQHLDKWVELLRRELGALCAVIDAPLTPGVPNKNNAISSHCGGASVPLPRTTHSGRSSSVLRTGLLMQNLIQRPHWFLPQLDFCFELTSIVLLSRKHGQQPFQVSGERLSDQYIRLGEAVRITWFLLGSREIYGIYVHTIFI